MKRLAGTCRCAVLQVAVSSYLRLFAVAFLRFAEARYNNQTCRHVSPHAAEWRSLQLLVTACRILSTLRALSSLRSLARCARHTIMQHLRVSVYLCVFGRVCMYLRVFARMCVYLLVFARICAYLRVSARICEYLPAFARILCVFAPLCLYLRVFVHICKNC